MLGESKTALSNHPKHYYLNPTAMRPELELLAKIDAYINKQLSNEELITFEQELSTNKELQKALQHQIDLREGLNYLSLKQKVGNAYKSYRFQKQLKTWGIIGLITLATIGAFLLSTTETEHSFELTNTTLPIINPEKGFEVGSRLPTQQYVISTASDTVIETSSGTVIAIPANSFNTDEQSVTFSVKEALTPEDIIKNGLSTFADEDELETAGMFHFAATDSKGDVDIRKDKKIMVDVPTNNKKANMLVYDGETDSTGNVNWIKPEKLENFLKTVDIFSLNLYPPMFEEKMADLGYANKPKAFKDSLFYSFFCKTEPELIEESEEYPVSEEDVLYNLNNDTVVDWSKVTASIENFVSEGHSSSNDENLFVYDFSCGGIEPSKIKAIWNKKFQNSLMATREFEERLQLIYKTCNPEILNLYVKGMKQPLYKLDKEAARLAFGNKIKAFKRFAARKEGRVKMNDKTISLLNSYYQKKSKLYSKASEKAYNDYWNKELNKDKQANEKRAEKRASNIKRKHQNFTDELERNMVSMFKQAGIPYPTIITASATPFNSIIPEQSYSFPLTSLGWKNIDRVTADATRRRESVTFKNGKKKASLSYSELNIKIEKSDSYDYSLVYLTSPTLTSYLKLKEENNIYSYKVNDSLNYNLIIISYKGDKAFLAKRELIKKGKYDISLNTASEKELDKVIQSLCPNDAPKGIKEDIAYKQFVLKEKSRRKKNKQLKTVRKELRPIIFPCAAILESDSITNEAPVYWGNEF